MRKYYGELDDLQKRHVDEIRRLREYYENEIRKANGRCIQWIALIVSLFALIAKLMQK